MLKERYFPDFTFWEPNLSYLWRSILGARYILVQGCRCQVNNSLTTLVWNHPWLPNTSNPWITLSVVNGLEDLTVSSFIVSDCGKWDVGIIVNFFN